MTASSPHVDLDVLADHAEGLLDEDTATEVSSHLTACDICASRVDDLRGVTSLLGAQEPPVMPAAVQQRVERAIRDEQHESPAGAGAATPIDQARDRRSRLSRALLAAAAAVVVVGVGGTVLQQVSPDGSAEPTSDAQAGAGAAQQSTQQSTQERLTQGTPDPRAPEALTDLPPPVAPREQRQPNQIEKVFESRTFVVRRERSACVGTAVADPRWTGTSYAVAVGRSPGAVAFLGDRDNTARKVQGVLVRCEPEPVVLQRRTLRR